MNRATKAFATALAVLAIRAPQRRQAVIGRPKPDPEPPDHYYTIDLLPELREAMIKMCRNGTVDYSLRKRIDGVLTDAKHIDGHPLPQASLPWSEIEAEAKRQGVGVADIVWDRRPGRQT